MKRSEIYNRGLIFALGVQFGGLLAGSIVVVNYAMICLFLLMALESIALPRKIEIKADENRCKSYS